MRKRNLIAVLAAFGALSIQTGLAADAAHPYSNVNRTVDVGNNTGDSQVDQLNEQQLRHVENNDRGQGGYADNGRDGTGYRPGYAYGYAPRGYYRSGAPYPYAAYPYPRPYYAPASYRPVFGWGWRPGWGWRRRYWGPRVGVGIVVA